jgi:hypothetical protein
MYASAQLGSRFFPECRRLPGHFGGACVNCKWRDYTARCTVRDENENDSGSGNNFSDDLNVEIVAVRRLEALSLEETAGVITGTENDPIAV